MPSVTSEDLSKIVSKMNVNKSSGFDDLRPREVKLIANANPIILVKILNNLLTAGFTGTLKTSICRPIFKKGDPLGFNNCRPICIQSTIGKLLEKYFAGKLVDYCTKYKIINENQFAYQPGKSAESLLTKFGNYVNNELNEGNVVGCIFVDFSRAFDTINHNILSERLNAIGVRGDAFSFIKKYLSDRSLVVKYGEAVSNLKPVGRGVPQGSTLGPLLYTLYVNDLFYWVKNCKMFIYANDIVHRSFFPCKSVWCRQMAAGRL